MYQIILTNKNPYPYKIQGDTIVSKIDVLKNNRTTYINNAAIELWLNWSGVWSKTNDDLTNTYGNCLLETSTDPTPSGITNCLGKAYVTINSVQYESNLVRYNFYSQPVPTTSIYLIDASGVSRVGHDIFDAGTSAARVEEIVIDANFYAERSGL